MSAGCWVPNKPQIEYVRLSKGSNANNLTQATVRAIHLAVAGGTLRRSEAAEDRVWWKAFGPLSAQ
jgi:hypothetical protein